MADELLRYAELVEETTFSQSPLPAQGNARSVYCDVTTIALDAPNETDNPVDSSFSRAPSRKYAGFYNPQGDIAYNINMQSLPYFLKWGLGDYAYTAGVGTPAEPNVHEAWGTNSRRLPSFLARCGKDNFEHFFSGSIIDTLQIEVEDALTLLTATCSSAIDGKASAQAFSAVLAKMPEEIEVPFHAVTMKLAGVTQADKIKSLTISVANNSDAEAGRYLGKRYPGRIPVNERETTLAMDMDFSDTAQIERIWGGSTGPSIQGSSTFSAEIIFNGGVDENDNALTCSILFPKVFWTTVESQPEGRDETVQSVEGRALTSAVTLDDGTTTVVTDIYAKTLSPSAAVQPAAA